MPANLVFYPYQLEDGSYIDKVSGKKLSMYGDIDKYPINITPYKTPKNYLGGGECISHLLIELILYLLIGIF